MRSYDDLSERLRDLRAWAGVPYRELHRRLVRARRRSGVAELPTYNTVYRCLQPGRTRLDADLVVDVAAVLLGDRRPAEGWRQACRVIEKVATDAGVVAVSGDLPADLPTFTGRAAELATLHRLIGDRTPVVLVEGMAGVGKTTMVAHVAHQLITRRPTVRCLSVNLRGYDVDRSPADPAAVLGGFLQLLGMNAGRIAHLSVEQRSAEFRERVADRDVVVLLDNAASASQVAPLLPGAGGPVAVVTSRRRLDGLDGLGVARLPLDVFTPDDSAALLRDVLGAAALDADPAAAAALADTVGHLPLALSLVAGRIEANPRWTLSDHRDRLVERRAGLRLDDQVQVAIDLSYGDLDDDHRRLLRRCAWHPTGDFDADTVAVLAETDLGTAHAHLEDLASAHLVTRRPGGRYALHDLVRVFAGDRARDEDPARARRAALGRLLDHYRQLAAQAMTHYAPGDRSLMVVGPAVVGTRITGRTDATRWLDTHRHAFVVAASLGADDGYTEHVEHLSVIVARYLSQGGHLDDAVTLHRLAARTATGRVRGQVLQNLGSAYFLMGRTDDARASTEAARSAYRQAGDEVGERSVRNNPGPPALFPGSLHDARRLLESAADDARAAGEAIALGRAVGNLAVVFTLLGQYGDAIRTCHEAIELARASGDGMVQAGSVVHLGAAHLRCGDHDRAVRALTDGLLLAREHGFASGEVDAISQLGDLQAALGRHEAALQLQHEALRTATDKGVPEHTVAIRNAQARSVLALGDHDGAADLYRRALADARKFGDRHQQAIAHEGIGHCREADGDTDTAVTHWRRALALHTELGTAGAHALTVRLRSADLTVPGMSRARD